MFNFFEVSVLFRGDDSGGFSPSRLGESLGFSVLFLGDPGGGCGNPATLFLGDVGVFLGEPTLNTLNDVVFFRGDSGGFSPFSLGEPVGFSDIFLGDSGGRLVDGSCLSRLEDLTSRSFSFTVVEREPEVGATTWLSENAPSSRLLFKDLLVKGIFPVKVLGVEQERRLDSVSLER
jgi:hypothetical protein